MNNMKSSSSSGKLAASSSSAKSKKSSKDREKRKSQSASEITNQHNSDKGSPNKDGGTRKYAGYAPEQLTMMAEQMEFEHLTEDVCMAFTEDINYKLRQVIYDALSRARLCGRNGITSTDIDDTFECLQIDKVYGAPAAPKWIVFSDQNLHYLDDVIIDFMKLAEEPLSYVQPMEVIVTQKWLPETKDVSKNLKLYFILMCQAVVEKDEEVRLTGLKDISENNLIGPIIEWFYHFGYFLLSKDITYDSLTLFAFDLIEALESNPISSLIVSDKQIILLTRLLLQRLLRSVTTTEIMKQMCWMLAILCKRIPIRKMILKKIVSKFPEIREDFALPVICTINELGLDAIYAVFIPHLNYLLTMIDDQKEPELAEEILRTYKILCAEQLNLPLLYDEFYEVFGDGVVPIWRHPAISIPDCPKADKCWLNIRIQLIKSRRKVLPLDVKKRKKVHIEEAFPEDDFDGIKEIFEYEFENSIVEDFPPTTKPNITFKFHSFAPAIGRLRFLNQAKFQPSQAVTSPVTIGKRTLLAPVLGTIVNDSTTRRKCTSHSLMYHNL